MASPHAHKSASHIYLAVGKSASHIYLAVGMVSCDFMAIAKNKHDVYGGVDAVISIASRSAGMEESKLSENLYSKVKDLSSETLVAYSNKLGGLAADIIEKASNGSKSTKMQFELLMRVYRNGYRFEMDYFKKYDLASHFKHYGDIKYLSSRYDAADLDDAGFDVDMLHGLVERSTVGADECKSGTTVYYLTPLGYHVAAGIYLKTLAGSEYTGRLDDDLEKAFERISDARMLFMDEIKLFNTPRGEVIDLVKKVLADASSALKKDLDSIKSGGLDYAELLMVREFLVKVMNMVQPINRECSKENMGAEQKKHAFELVKWISDVYLSVAQDKLVLPFHVLRY